MSIDSKIIERLNDLIDFGNKVRGNSIRFSYANKYTRFNTTKKLPREV